MDTIAEFVTRTHTKRTDGTIQPSRNIGIKDARAIAESVDWSRMAELADAAHAYLPAVLAEIDSLRLAHARNAERMKLRALLFGIATPNRDEIQSIGWALSADEYYDLLSPMLLARKPYVSLVTGKTARMGLYEQLAETIAHSRLRQTLRDMNLDALESLPGVGPKVARMITAVCNPDAPVFTVDLWHMRQLLWASGQEYCVKCGTGGKAYAILENIWLTYAKTFFPEVPTWCVQWSTWCAAEGKFVSHQALWADLAA
jgi:hypothetical protein